jgi:hypothetical protein
MSNDKNNVFWYNDPRVLLEQSQLLELYPTSTMNFESKLNAITRLVIGLSVVGFFVTFQFKYIVICVITLVLLLIIYHFRKKTLIETLKSKTVKEGFAEMKEKDTRTTTNPVTLETVLKSKFYKSNNKNPFGNVLLTEIGDNPQRKSAAPSFNLDVSEDITKDVKRTVQSLNPEITNTNKQLYGDLFQKFELDQSNRVFFSTANTKVTSDQGAFAEFLYGNMPSAKEGDTFALLQDNYRHVLN